MTDVAGRLRTTVEALSVAGIDFVIVGGVAAALQGATRVTQDVDILFDRDPANRSLLATFLVAHHARPRGAWPDDVEFVLDAVVLDRCELLTLETDLGLLDVLARVPGIGDFADALRSADVMALDEHRVLVLSVEGLIRAKEATARPKDLDALHELRALADVQRAEADARAEPLT